MRRPALLVAAVAILLVLLAASCGGGESASTTTEVTETTPPPEDYPADPEAQETLRRFIEAAGARDTTAMWNLLDSRSQQRHGPSMTAWADGAGDDLVVVLGSFARPGGGYEPVVARRISDVRSVAAVQGFVPAGDDTEWGAYAAVVVHENGERKISLAGTATFNPVVPEPELKSDSTPDVATEVEAAEPILTTAMWVDRTPLEGDLSPDALFLTSRVTTPLEPGRHTIVSYADTQSGAGANAWTFVSR